MVEQSTLSKVTNWWLSWQEGNIDQEHALRAQNELESMETIEKISKPCPQCKAKTERSGKFVPNIYFKNHYLLFSFVIISPLGKGCAMTLNLASRSKVKVISDIKLCKIKILQSTYSLSLSLSGSYFTYIEPLSKGSAVTLIYINIGQFKQKKVRELQWTWIEILCQLKKL